MARMKYYLVREHYEKLDNGEYSEYREIMPMASFRTKTAAIAALYSLAAALGERVECIHVKGQPDIYEMTCDRLSNSYMVEGGTDCRRQELYM